jgi:hypothetical protein
VRLLFAAGDIGGAKALFGIIEECIARSIPFGVLKNGWLASAKEECLGTYWEDDEPSVLFEKNKYKALIFASSVHDCLPLAYARAARNYSIPIVHVLDSWSMYLERLATDGLEPLLPDIYTVIDDEAFCGAVASGVPQTILKPKSCGPCIVMSSSG